MGSHKNTIVEHLFLKIRLNLLISHLSLESFLSRLNEHPSQRRRRNILSKGYKNFSKEKIFWKKMRNFLGYNFLYFMLGFGNYTR